jgi:AcrR family transcriptional regulator
VSKTAVNLPRRASLPRRTRAERSALSTRRLIDAAVRALDRDGYGAVTVSVVIDEAGASRGAFLHHFPTKADLMLAVVRHVWDIDRRYYSMWFSKIPDPKTRFLEFVQPGWKALSRPTGIAVTEILIACRSDSSMAKLVIPAQLKIQQEARQFVLEHVRGMGITSAEITSFLRFAEATLRGLSIDLMLTKDPSSVGPTLARIRYTAEQLLR